MTRTLPRPRPRRAGETGRRAYQVRRVNDAGRVRDVLEQDRAYAAFALAQLDPALFPLNEWFIADGPAGPALVLHSRSGLGPALFATGDPDAVNAILSLHPGARFSFGSFRLEHRPVIERYFLMTRTQIMLRMAVTRNRFTSAPGPAERLTGRDVAIINQLYSAQGSAGSYRASHINEGVYYGVFADGKLVSIAGTHAVSATEGIAVVGNVFTHPRYRRRGLARIVTSAVTAELLEMCPLAVLTVEATNDPAVRAYTRLGYQTECTLHETPLIRKEPLGAISLARRLTAAWRGRAEGKEVVLQ